MAIPLFLIGGATILLTGTGVKKGFDAKEKNKKAKDIIKNIERDFEFAKEELEVEREKINETLQEYGKYKLEIFSTRMQILLNILKCQKKAKSNYNHEVYFSDEQVTSLKHDVENSYEILSGLGKGVASGVLTAYGAYGTVGLIAEASTGTAIASLSGAAATNATLAWLGGGSIATGGYGIVGGIAVLGSIVAGPAIAVTGFAMDSKAEKNLTKAKEFESEVKIKIEKIKVSIKGFEAIRERINEMESIINKFVNKFDTIYNNILNKQGVMDRFKDLFKTPKNKSICKHKREIEQLITLGKAIKETLSINLLDEEGNENKQASLKLNKIVKTYHLEN
jgi:proteasome assembly chaperone (PAC2) family protein